MSGKYEKVSELLSIVKELTSQGKTQQQIADELGLGDKRVVGNLLYRERQKEKVTAELQLHSDQGFQYTSQAYFKLTQSYGIVPSMSGCGIRMTMPWLKISSQFSKPSVYTE